MGEELGDAEGFGAALVEGATVGEVLGFGAALEVAGATLEVVGAAGDELGAAQPTIVARIKTIAIPAQSAFCLICVPPIIAVIFNISQELYLQRLTTKSGQLPSFSGKALHRLFYFSLLTRTPANVSKLLISVLL